MYCNQCFASSYCYYNILFNLHIYYQNVRGLKTKTIDLYHNISTHNYDVIVLTETWLHSGVYDSELFDDRYIVYRRDRQTSRYRTCKEGGGVLIAILKHLKSNRLSQFESELEDICVSVDVSSAKHHNKNICINGVYLPPPVSRDTLALYTGNVQKLLDKHQQTLILGDFNQRSISWIPKDHILFPDCKNSDLHAIITEFMTSNALNQYNPILNNKHRILDLILSNINVENLMRSSIALTKEDPLHPPLEFYLPLLADCRLEPKNILKPNFFRADYNKVLNQLRIIEWEREFNTCSSVNQSVDVFYSI